MDFFEDEYPAGLLWIETRRLDDPHHGVNTSIAVYITRLKLVDRVGELPVVQPIKTVMLLSQCETLFFARFVALCLTDTDACKENNG